MHNFDEHLKKKEKEKNLQNTFDAHGAHEHNVRCTRLHITTYRSGIVKITI